MLSHSGFQWRHIAVHLTEWPNLVNCINLGRKCSYCQNEAMWSIVAIQTNISVFTEADEKSARPMDKSCVKAGTDYRTCSVAQPPRQPRTWCSSVWEKMLVAQTAAAAGPNQHSAARNAFVFVLKTDNFWFVLQQYSSASEHIHSMFAAGLLTVHTTEHHVLGCRVRLCHGICSIVCTGLDKNIFFQLASWDTQY